MKAAQSISHRTISSILWNIPSNLIRIVVLLVRSILLARLLPVDVFGVYAGAGAIVVLSSIVATFGMGGAFLHRCDETEDEEQAAAVHLTLKLLFTLLWAVLLFLGALLFAEGPMRTALLVLTAATAGLELAQTPELILTRRVVHRRLAMLQLVNALATTVAALALAYKGTTLWALLSTDIVAMLVTCIGLYLWKPVWRPRLDWSPPIVRYYLRFGSKNLVAGALLLGLDRVDDLWTQFHLGLTALGYYSRAYTFATYPRRILAAPVNLVAGGTYAELKVDRARLSQAFFRTNALLVRSGFLLAGWLGLAAPEFIRIFLGAKWLPMLDAFRLMLIYTLLDPIKMTVGDLFVAVGKPERVVGVRTIQLAVMALGLYLLGPRLGITGVALAVDLMLVVGMVLLLWQARTHVDFSPLRLFGAPALALIAGLVVAYSVSSLPPIPSSDWITGLLKVSAYGLVYGGILLALERQQLLQLLAYVTTRLPSRDRWQGIR